MAYFECTIGGASGDGVALIVQCDANFAGSVITADNGVDSFSETCPSVSPYTVKFEGIPIGTYTISGVSQGQTFTTQFTVLDYQTTLNSIPDGATVTPTDDIQTWLHCANIWDKNYTAIAQVLADASTLQALIASNNAVDYMARSTTWASSVTANSNAMTYIGANDYCANALLDDSTWLNAICNSTYFESVLNVKVPTLSNTNVSSIGTAYASGFFPNVTASDAAYYRGFDGIDNTDGGTWSGLQNQIAGAYLGFKFNSKVKCYKVSIKPYPSRLSTFKVQGSDDGTYTDISGTLTANSATWFTFNLTPTTAYKWLRAYALSAPNGAPCVSIYELQFYCRYAN